MFQATEPVLRPVRKIIRPMAGLDFSFLVVILVAQIVLIPVLQGLSGITGIEGGGWVDSAAMDNSQAPSSILDTLRTVEFRLGLKGYNVDEVDEYLDKAAQEAEALQEHVRQLNERLRQASERIAQLERDEAAAPPGRGGGRRGAGAAAAAAAEHGALRRDAAAHAPARPEVRRPDEAGERGGGGGRRGAAEETARAAIAAAEATAAQLQAETHQKLREEVTRLEATRTELATDVESMARHLESERNRLRGALSEILKWVDENVQPANSLMGVKPKPAPAQMGLGRAVAARGGRRPADLEPPERLRRRRGGGAPPRLTAPSGVTAVLPLAVPSGIVTRSPDEVVVSGMGPRRVVRRRER